MHEIMLFVEDAAHETFLRALVTRIAEAHGAGITFIPRSVRGGHGKVLTELSQFLRDLRQEAAPLPDLLIVATDGNCRGFAERKRELDRIVGDLTDFVIYAIPDPHIERWLLLDSAAFRTVLGKGCDAPDQKCERGRYKEMLRHAVEGAGITPLVGGIEHTEALVEAMDLQQVSRRDASLGRLISALNVRVREWGTT